MPTYAIKIGEILLKSDKPITEEQRIAAIKMLRGEEPMSDKLQEGLELVKLAVDSH